MSFRSVPVFGGSDRQAVEKVPERAGSEAGLRRTRRWSWMVSGWFERIEFGPEQGGTACMTLGCATDFVAVRLGFPNLSRQPWTITRAIARPSDSFNNYVTPTGEAGWTAFTTAHGGADSSQIITSPNAPTEIAVRGLDDTPLSQAGRVSWTWTDWAPIRSLQPDPASGMRVLMLRALIPSSQSITYAAGQFRKFTGNKTLNRGHDVLIGGLKFNLDLVTDPDRDRSMPTQTWIDNQLAPGTLFPMVQFLTETPGISGIAAGDSHAQGTATTEQFSSFLYVATTSLGQEYSGSIPFSMVNTAVGGLGSEEFLARFEALLAAVQPSYAVLLGWTFNDKSVADKTGNDKTGVVKADQAAMNIFFARLISAIELCCAQGVRPVVLTPFPRNADMMTDVQMGPWHWLRQQLLRLRDTGLTVIDTTPMLGQQQNDIFDGSYLAALTDDQMHPNDAGHQAVGLALAKTIKSLL